jgi:hypothetical protein
MQKHCSFADERQLFSLFLNKSFYVLNCIAIMMLRLRPHSCAFGTFVSNKDNSMADGFHRKSS